MQEPYLVYGVCFPANTTEPQQQQLLDDISQFLPRPSTPLSVPCTYVVKVLASNAYTTWENVSDRLANHWDPMFNGDLQWFVHLADRAGCELSYN